MRRLVLVAAFAVSFLTLPILAAEDFTGKWSGTFTGIGPDGQQSTETVVFNFVHKGSTLTGTGGPNDQRQWKIANGKVESNALSFDVQADGDGGGGPLLTFHLALADGHLKGDVNAQMGDKKLTAKADVTRVK